MHDHAVLKAVRGPLLDITKPVEESNQIASHVRYIEDGMLLIQNGKIQWSGSWDAGQPLLPKDCLITHYPDKFIVPGFVDTHINCISRLKNSIN